MHRRRKGGLRSTPYRRETLASVRPPSALRCGKEEVFLERHTDTQHAHFAIGTVAPPERTSTAAQADGRQLWVTDLSQEAAPLCAHAAGEPALPRLAVVVGSEGAGVSKTMLAAADRRGLPSGVDR